MIHFDFKVTDEEGFALFSCITERIATLLEDKLENPYDATYHKQLDEYIEFLNVLKKKMTNRSV